MINAHSEIGLLKKVIVHSPDIGIQRISPKRAEELLFDDIVYYPKMLEEHTIFTEVLSGAIGKENVIRIEDLLMETLKSENELKEEMLNLVIIDEELPTSYFDYLKNQSAENLSNILITGYNQEDDHILFDPIPNFIFTRDIAVSIKDHLIITKAAKIARQRENLLTRYIFHAHPSFKSLIDEDKIINLNNLDEFPPSKKGEKVSIEGGDIMMIENDYLLVGCSERSTPHGFDLLKNAVFEKGVLNHMVKIIIPSDRSCMHIDTLFTRIDKETVVCYKPIVFDGLSSNVEVHCSDGSIRYYSSVKDFFIKEINESMKFIFAGMGESPFQEREQWTDGCNLVALKPGIAITYDRNPKTEIAFEKAGYSMMTAADFIAGCKKDNQFFNTLERTIITLPSSELSRARGGSHCMTCPIQRGSVRP